MRDGSLLTLPGLLLGATTLCIAAIPAGAQTRPGWVDPPPRAAAPEAKGEGAEGNAAKENAAKENATKPAEIKATEIKPAEPVPEGAKPADAPPPPAAGNGIASAPSDSPALRAAAPRQSRRIVSPRPPRLAAPAPVIARGGFTDPRFPEWAARAQRLSSDHLDSVSASGDGIAAAAPRLYAERVRFHGRTLSLAALIAEKRRFARRWPERRYEAQPGSTRVACSAAALCIVRATFDFRADNPARGARSQGVGEVALEISFSGERPVIVSETSRVLRRLGPVSALKRPQRGA